MSLKCEPQYIIEVISEKFDRLGETEKNKVLLHEIVHIPKNFSGSLMPHIRRGRNKFEDKLRYLVAQYLKQR
jgi:predicted metallopeptidase